MDFDGPPPPELLQGVEEFNRGEYFRCHDTLERLWRRERGPVRELYQGIIQVAVGLHHLGGGNRKGALRLLERGAKKLERFSPSHMGIDVADLARQARECRAAVASNEDEVPEGWKWPPLRIGRSEPQHEAGNR